jgi:hypothetical protein
MKQLKDIFETIGVSLTTSTGFEVFNACKNIIEVQSFTSCERDTLRAAFKHGPLWDGDVPSKKGRDTLLDLGYIEKVIVKGEFGFNACTYSGGTAYKIMEALGE